MKWTEAQLYEWVRRQRTLKNHGKLEPRRIALLEHIPGWSWNPEEDYWNQKYELSKKYGVVDRNFTTPDGIKLGIWQMNMRANGGYNKVMTPERRKLLEKIPDWFWKADAKIMSERVKSGLKKTEARHK